MTKLETAIFGGGCFWCTEAIFQELKGVEKVESGYASGPSAHSTSSSTLSSLPRGSSQADQGQELTYEEVCGGNTGYAEVIRIEFDPRVITYQDLLHVFFSSHNPTLLNQQGNDIGQQYRSLILCADEEQKREAEKYIKELDASKKYDRAVVTEVEPFGKFYKAEEYHQNYYRSNKSAPYCMVVIDPKIEKLKKEHKKLLRDE